MASDRILALNIGAGHITLGEFKIAAGKQPVLQRYGIAPLGLDPDSEMDPSGFIIAAVGDLMKANGIKPGPLMMTVSGQMVFPRFVKFPAIAPDKLRAMIQSEAEQNVPFPIEELTWDSQMIGTDEMGECNAMIVAAKTDGIVALTNSIEGVRLEPEVVDVAPLSIYNCAAAGQAGQDGCTMVLDVGARSTNLVFVESGKVFYRSIPVAGNSITQEIAKNFGIDFRAAEQMKREIGFVALGGVTATEDEQADRASKCIRGVVTRLHAEVNRSINFYRSQQGGSAPTRVLLTGGSASLRHIDTFFREKLRIDVDYLNPFDSVQLGPHVDSERASAEFLQLAEICGLALRRSGLGHVEINLMPPNLVQKKTFRKQAPILIASSVLFAAAAAILFLAGAAKARTAEEERDVIQEKVAGLDRMGKNVTVKVTEREEVARDLDKYRSLLISRESVLKSIDAIRASMLPGTWVSSLESCELSLETTDESGDKTSVKVPGYRIVIRGFLDVLRKVESEARSGKTAAEIFCIQLTDIRRPFKSATIKGQRESGADNLAEFTVEAVLRTPLSALEEAELAGKAAK